MSSRLQKVHIQEGRTVFKDSGSLQSMAIAIKKKSNNNKTKETIVVLSTTTTHQWSQSTLISRRHLLMAFFIFLCILLVFSRIAKEGTLLSTFLVSLKIEEEEEDAANSFIPYIKELRRNPNLTFSYRQQRKFFTVKDKVIATILDDPNQRHLYHDDGKYGRLFAIILNDQYAFRHILKCGGTTVGHQVTTNDKIRSHYHVPSWNVENHSLVAVVRDPIDKFLSGWSECGSIHPTLILPRNETSFLESSYERRVREWFQFVTGPREGLPQDIKNCRPHSYPQANFVLVPKGNTTHPKLDMLGDLRELPYVLRDIVGYPFNFTLKRGNTGVGNRIKMEWFPRKLHLLSNDTLKDICRFVALDYYMFDFEPPEVCKTDPTVLPLLHHFDW